eukprot:9287689-Pyramimonas_sp.AAC.1
MGAHRRAPRQRALSGRAVATEGTNAHSSPPKAAAAEGAQIAARPRAAAEWRSVKRERDIGAEGTTDAPACLKLHSRDRAPRRTACTGTRGARFGRRKWGSGAGSRQ